MIRLTRALPVAVATVVLLAACSSEAPQGATLPPLTTAVGTTTAESTGSAMSSSSAPTSEETTTPGISSSESSSESTSVDSVPVESVPTEASALPLPTEQINVPADNPQEEADRAAIEAVWRQVWDLYTKIDTVPESDRRAAVEALAVGDLADQLVAVGEQSNIDGVTSYGTPILHPYWYRPVDGKNLAVLADCRDTSNFGDVDIATGEKKTVGVPASNTVGQFTRIDGHWKLWAVTYIDTPSCTS